MKGICGQPVPVTHPLPQSPWHVIHVQKLYADGINGTQRANMSGNNAPTDFSNLVCYSYTMRCNQTGLEALHTWMSARQTGSGGKVADRSGEFWGERFWFDLCYRVKPMCTFEKSQTCRIVKNARVVWFVTATGGQILVSVGAESPIWPVSSEQQQKIYIFCRKRVIICSHYGDMTLFSFLMKLTSSLSRESHNSFITLRW